MKTWDYQLNDNQLKYLADILNNAGIVFLASMVVPIFGQQQEDIYFIFSGLSIAFCFWFIGLIILSQRRKEE